jgi:hypothetical protein
MADTVTVHVQGLQTIDAALREMSKAMQDKILGDSILGAGEVLKKATAGNIHSRTGRTAADIRVFMQIQPGDLKGAALIGGTKGSKSSRGYILNYLERGTKAHPIPKKRKSARITLTLGGRSVTRRGPPRKNKVLTVGGKFYSRVEHKGTHAQAPLRIALAEAGEQSVAVFGRTAWEGIRAVAVDNGFKG